MDLVPIYMDVNWDQTLYIIYPHLLLKNPIGVNAGARSAGTSNAL